MDISFSFTRKTASLVLLLVISLLEIGPAAAVAGTDEVTGHVDGIPQNWFPSATAFVVFFISLYINHTADQADRYSRCFYLLLAFVSVSVSMYYGSNLYAHPLWETAPGILPGIALKLLCMLAAVILCLRLIFVVKDKWSRARTAAWFIFLFAAFSLHNLYAAELAFAAFACLLLSLAAHVSRWQPVPKRPEELARHGI